MNVIFDHKEQLAPSIVSYYFKPPGIVRYIAGQFIELTLPHKNPDERGIKRWFTISSAPQNDFIVITTKHSAGNGSSFKNELASLHPGTTVHMSDPMGDFVLPKDKTLPLVFVAGGIGITPFHSMLAWLDNKNEQRDIQLVYAVKAAEELVFTSLFENMDIDYITLTGKRPTASAIEDIVGGLENKRLYLSGPEPMIEALEQQFINIDIDEDRIVTDFFPNYSMF